jgi:peptide deformylase
MLQSSNQHSDFANAKSLGFEIVTLGHPSLRRLSKSMSMDAFKGRRLNSFITDLRHTLDRTGGVGLAAPQVGVNIELFVTQIPQRCAYRYLLCRESACKVWINPRYEIIDSEELIGIEGCLSVPGYVGKVARPKEIRVRALDEHGDEFVEDLIGWNARVFLHEYDHLKGVVYIDTLLSGDCARGNLYEEKMWTTIESQKRKSKDSDWLREYNMAPD